VVAVPVLTVDLGPGVLAGFTGRAGGCSVGSWSGLDVALHVGDEPGRVAENRRRVAAWAGAPVVFARQVHGARCAVVSRDGELAPDPFAPDPFAADVGVLDGGYDALATADRGTALGVLVADCVPVLLADVTGGIVATAHAGRSGLLAGVLAGVLAAMRQLGARPERVRAALGPAAGPCCYEIPRQLQDDVCALLPQARSTTAWGTPSLDLRAGCRAVLQAEGVCDIQFVGGCTVEDERFFSYRRSPVTGRFAGVVRMVR
jgi:YfiH family protein